MINRERWLVTGARKGWTRDEVWDALTMLLNERGCSVSPIVVHGDAKGVDTFCKEWASQHFGFEEEGHPVTEDDWETKGRSAALQRNSYMVSLGADIGIAFLAYCVKNNCWKPGVHYSHGTEHCMKEMRKAGIYVYEFVLEEK